MQVLLFKTIIPRVWTLILITIKFNEWQQKPPLLKLISVPTIAYYKLPKVWIFLKRFWLYKNTDKNTEYNTLHQRKTAASCSDTYKSQVWTYLDSWKVSLLKHLKINQAALLLLLLVMFMHGVWREDEAEFKFLASFIKISPHQTKLFLAN